MNVIPQRVPLFFSSPKATDPIRYVGPSAHDLLVQATFDFRIRGIGYVDVLPLDCRPVRVAAPVMEREEGMSVVLLNGMHPDRDAEEGLVAEAIAAAGLGIERVSPAELGREPLATTARVVWRQRHVSVDPAMRLALAAAFDDEATLTVGELCSRVSGPRDPVFAIMALACETLLHLDLSRGFDRETTVRGPR